MLGHEQCKVITTRSGLQLKDKEGTSTDRVQPEKQHYEDSETKQDPTKSTATAAEPTVSETLVEAVADKFTPGIKLNI